MAAKPVYYHHGMRELQDVEETRALADKLEELIVHSAFTADEREFIESLPMCFVATADEKGRPDCSYKGGLPGFVRVAGESTLCIPEYDGNGMYRTWGNVRVNPAVGLIFLDFEKGRRLRVNGTATLDFEDPLLADSPGAVFMVKITAEEIFMNCPRYIHKMKMVGYSRFAPKANYQVPEAEWKQYEVFHDVLPERDRKK